MRRTTVSLAAACRIREARRQLVIEPPDDDPAQAGQLPLVFVPVPEPKTSENRVHLDVASTSEDHKAALVARLEGLGDRRIDVLTPR
jgi:glyoxalase superfamily protein